MNSRALAVGYKPVKLFSRTAAILLSALLVACGGGEGGGSGFPLLPISPPAPTYQATMTPTAGEVTVGKTLQLAVSMVDSQGRNVANPPTVFTSSDPALATVASLEGAAATGVVTGVAVGSVQITAKATAPDGAVLTQQATVTVVAAPLTYKLVLPNPTVNLQFNQPMSVSATVLASDGTDVTASASGWSWSSSDTAVVGITPSGPSASLLASNARQAAASATIAAQATAPNGSVVSGQIAATALPHYTYQAVLSAATAKVASDRPAVIKVKVLRSDGTDVTGTMSNWAWTWPSSADNDDLAVTLSDNGTTATFTSKRADRNAAAPDAGSDVQVMVSADGLSSPTILTLTQLAAYTFVASGTFSGPINTTLDALLQRFHSSLDGAPNEISQCQGGSTGWQASYGTCGAFLSSISWAQTGHFYFQASQPGQCTVTLTCMSSAEVPLHTWEIDLTIQ